jgi:hypothetical protein
MRGFYFRCQMIEGRAKHLMDGGNWKLLSHRCLYLINHFGDLSC